MPDTAEVQTAVPARLRDSGVRWLWLSAAVLLLDQLSKQMIEGTLELYERVDLLPGFSLTLVYNRGAAFSLLSDAGGWQRWFFATLAFVISIVLVIWVARIYREKGNTLEALALSLILGGAVGNLYDRVVLGHVVDFIVLHYQTSEWPAFNIADSAICIGAALLILDMFKGRKVKDE